MFSYFLSGWERVAKSFSFTSEQNLRSFLFCKMVLKGIPVILIFRGMIWNEKWSSESFLFYETVPNGIPIIFIFEFTKFRVFFPLLQNGLERNHAFFLIFRGMDWNRIPRVFRSSKQAEFQRNESKFPCVPCSVEYFFSRKMATLAQRYCTLDKLIP
jgi:hypothetical protein